ncbi:MAG: gliding motility-associated C-terminal domain-containing protein [Bacteroidia bacterium]
MNSSLDLQWSKEVIQPSAMLGNTLHEIHAFGEKSVFALDAPGAVRNVIGLLDENGEILWAMKTNASLVNEIQNIGNDLLLFAPDYLGISRQPRVFALDSNGIFKWAKALPQQPSNLSGTGGRHSLFPKGDQFHFIHNQEYQSDQVIMVNSLFDSAGKMLSQSTYPYYFEAGYTGLNANYTLVLARPDPPNPQFFSSLRFDELICNTTTYSYEAENFILEFDTVNLNLVNGPQFKPYYLPISTGSVPISGEVVCRKPAFPKDTALCYGNILHLTIDSNDAKNIIWSTGDTTGSISIDKSGTYWVRRTFSNCFFTDTIHVKIYEKVLITLPEDSLVCPGTDVELVAHHQGISFKWYGPNNLEVVSDTIFADTAGLYRVRVADAGGCVDLDTFELKLHPKPVAYAAPDTTVCLGDSVTLRGTPQQNCNWTGPSLISSQCAVTVFPNSTSRYSFSTANSFGCTDTASVLVQVPEIQTSEISPIRFCENENPKLIKIKSNDIAVWNWRSTTGQLLDTGKVLNFSLYPLDTLILMANNSCAITFTDTIIVTINDTPTSDITITPTTGCLPVLVNFSFHPVDFDQVYIDFGDGDTAIYNSAPFNHNYTEQGEFSPSIKLTSDQGCSSIIPVKETIRTLRTPHAHFAINPEPLIVPDTFTLLNISLNSDSIIWSINGDSLFGNEKNIFVEDSGQYIVKLIALNEFCRDSIERKLQFIAIPFFWIPNAFSPNSDATNDFFSPTIIGYEPVRLRIFDRWGERIFDSKESRTLIWDGTSKGIATQDGSYFYIFEVISSEGKGLTLKGMVNIVR